MGNIVISIQPELTAPVTEQITISDFVITECSTDFNVSVLNATTSHISWTFSAGVVIQGGGISEDLTNPGAYVFTVSIPGFRGFATAKQTVESSVLITLKDSEFGSVLDTKEVKRKHTGINCS